MQKRLPSSLPVTSAILYYRKLVWSQAEGYLDFLEEFFTSQVSVRIWTALRYNSLQNSYSKFPETQRNQAVFVWDSRICM